MILLLEIDAESEVDANIYIPDGIGRAQELSETLIGESILCITAKLQKDLIEATESISMTSTNWRTGAKL